MFLFDEYDFTFNACERENDIYFACSRFTGWKFFVDPGYMMIEPIEI